MSDNVTRDTPEKKEPKWKARFLESLARSGNVLLACRAAGVPRMRAYRLRNRCPVFAARWDDAIEESTDVMEAEARRRAVQGTEKPVYYKGEKVDTVREYSDTLLIFLMKAHRPEKYRDNYDLKRLLDNYAAERKDLGEPAPVDPAGD